MIRPKSRSEGFGKAEGGIPRAAYDKAVSMASRVYLHAFGVKVRGDLQNAFER